MFLNKYKILKSVGSKEKGKHSNQVIERFHRTFWDWLGKYSFKGAQKKSFWDLSFEEQELLVSSIITIYNTRQPTQMRRPCPKLSNEFCAASKLAVKLINFLNVNAQPESDVAGKIQTST